MPPSRNGAALGLRAASDPFTTASSTLTPVLTAEGQPAMLKLSLSAEETRGAAVPRGC